MPLKQLSDGNPDGVVMGQSSTDKIGFYNATTVVKPTVTGSKGANEALTSLLTALANLGLLTDRSS